MRSNKREGILNLQFPKIKEACSLKGHINHYAYTKTIQMHLKLHIIALLHRIAIGHADRKIPETAASEAEIATRRVYQRGQIMCKVPTNARKTFKQGVKA